MVWKDSWKSKTLWFNILALLILVINPFGFADHIPDDKLVEYATAIITMINVVLRFVTSQPLKLL